jgi:RNA polymerase sigma-70 factor, ECF subfamily
VSRTETPTQAISSGTLFAAYHDKIRHYVLSMVHDPVEADDLTQDVFLQVHRKLDSVRDRDAIVSWMYRIATHVCYDRFRSSSRQPRAEPLEVDPAERAVGLGDIADQLSLGRALEQTEMSACVRRYIEELSTEYQQVIFLHDVEGSSNPQIAEMLGASVDAVKIRLHRARRKLQVALSEHCDLSLDEQGVLVCEPAATRPGTN